MPNIRVRCSYCGTAWQEYVYSNTPDAPNCPKCRVNTDVELVKEKTGSGNQYGYPEGENNG